MSEGPTRRGPGDFTYLGETEGEKASAWAREETGACFLVPPALEVIVKGLGEIVTPRPMRCGPSAAGESPGICSEFSISGAPGRDCERFVGNTCPWGARAASAHALKG